MYGVTRLTIFVGGAAGCVERVRGRGVVRERGRSVQTGGSHGLADAQLLQVREESLDHHLLFIKLQLPLHLFLHHTTHTHTHTHTIDLIHSTNYMYA